jgi:hypothetical protein
MATGLYIHDVVVLMNLIIIENDITKVKHKTPLWQVTSMEGFILKGNGKKSFDETIFHFHYIDRIQLGALWETINWLRAVCFCCESPRRCALSTLRQDYASRYNIFSNQNVISQILLQKKNDKGTFAAIRTYITFMLCQDQI